MSSFNPINNKNSHINSSNSPHFINPLHQIHDNDQFDFAPHIQQYNFQSFSPKNSKQLHHSKKSSTNKQSHLAHKQSQLANKYKFPSKQLENKQSSQVNKNSFINKNSFMNKKQSQLIQKLSKKVQILQKQNIQLKRDKQDLIHKIQILEDKINQLTRNLVIERNKNNDYQLEMNNNIRFNNSLSNKKSIQRRSKQNSLAMVSPSVGVVSPSSSRQKTISTSPLLLKQLLLQCNESKQYDDMKKSIKTKYTNYKDNTERWDKDQFYQYKNTKDCFQPFYSHLSRELQLRCKKSLIRQKQLIFKNDNVQIGCISRKLQNHQFQINIVITNLQTQPIKNINLAYLYKNDIEFNKQVKSSNLQITKTSKDHTAYSLLNSAEQIKQTTSILTHTVDFRCIVLSLQFVDYRNQNHKITQILPGSKHRLFTHLVVTPIPPTFVILQKIILFDKKFLPELQKLKSYYKSIHFTTDRHKNTQALLKLQFLSKIFYVGFKMLGSDKLTITVHHSPQQPQLAQKILGEFTFIFQR